MKISTAGRYGIRVMLDLAMQGKSMLVSRQEIADRQAISSEYIAQLVRHLSRAGLIESVMGPGGGYRLKADPQMIRLGDIFRAVEGPVAVVACVNATPETVCARAGTCATRVIWARLSSLIEEYLDSLTLDDLSQITRQIGDPNHCCAAPVEQWADQVEQAANPSVLGLPACGMLLASTSQGGPAVEPED